MRKWFILLSLLFVLLPVILGLTWYALVSWPNFDKIIELAKDGKMQVAPIKDSFYELATIVESKDNIWFKAINNAYCSQIHTATRSDCHPANIKNIAWAFVGGIHMQDSDEFSLWVKCALNGCNDGIANASKDFFGKPISELSLEEQAGIIIYVSSQTRLVPGTSEFKRRVNEMMDKIDS